jgi:hypothetical protein
MSRVFTRAVRPPFSPRPFLISLPALVLALSILPPVPTALAGESSRLERQLEIVEEAINDMLIDSPNFLVSGSEVTQSIDDEEGGVLFIFRATLTSPGWHPGGGILSNLGWRPGEKSIIVLKDRQHEGEKELSLNDADISIKDGEITIRDKDGKKFDLDDMKLQKMNPAKAEKTQLEKYQKAKEEMVQVLIDYGEILKALPAGQSVRIVARLHDLDLPKDQMVRKLSVRAKIDDLRAYGDGKLSEQEMRSRVEIRES